MLRNGILENERNFRKVNFFSLFPVKVTGQSWGGCAEHRLQPVHLLEMEITVSGGEPFSVADFY